MDSLSFSYEKKIEELKQLHQQEISLFKERFEQLRYQYRPELEEECRLLEGSLKESRYILSKLREILDPIKVKFEGKNLVHYDTFQYKELETCSYLSNLLMKFYSDNKYLLEIVTQQENNKKEMTEQMNLPFVSNAVSKNKILLDIREDLYKVENSNKVAFNKMTDLMAFINSNFSEVLN